MANRYPRLSIGFLLFLFIATASPELIAQLPAGREFVVALPSFWRRSDPVDPGRLELTILASRRTDITIKWSGPGGGVLDQATINDGGRLTFSSGFLFQIFNFVQLLENRDPQLVNQRSFYIESTHPVSVIATYDDYRRSGSVTETWAVQPIETYGTEYSVLTYSGAVASNSGFLIMASEDSTEVTFTPSTLWDTPSDGTTNPVTKMLQKYQVFQVYSNSVEDMSGSTLTATKPVGVLPFSRRTNVHELEPFDTSNAYQTEWRQSALADVMPSHDLAGTQFYTMPFGPHDTSQVRVIATVDGTQIRLNSAAVSTIDAGEYVEMDIGAPSRIDATSPVMAVQIARSGNNPLIDTIVTLDASKPNERDTIAKINGNPGMAWLPPVSAWKPTLHWTNPLIDNRRTAIPGKDSIDLYPWIHYAMITTSRANAPTVRIDDQPVDFDYTHFDGAMVTAIVPVLPRPHLITSEGPVTCLAYGFGYNDGYAMVTSEALRSIARLDVDTIRASTCDTLLDVFFELSNVGNNGFQVDSIRGNGIEVRSVRQPLGFPTVMPPGRVLDGHMVVRLPEARTYAGSFFVYTDANNEKTLEIPFVITRDSARLSIVENVDFGLLGPGTTEKDTTLTLRNDGDSPITIEDLSSTDSRFTIVSPSVPRTIPPGGSMLVTVRLTPRPGVAESGRLLIDGTPCVTPISVDLTGFQGAGSLLDVVRTVRFPSFLCEGRGGTDTTIVLRSTGDEPLEIRNITVTGANAGFFQLQRNPAPITLTPGTSDSVIVRYVPGVNGRHQADLEIASDGVNVVDPLKISLSGALDTAMAQPQERQLRFGTILSCDDPKELVARLVNGGTIEADIDTVFLESGTAFSISGQIPTSIPPAGIERTVSVEFAPQSSGTFYDTLVVRGGPCGIDERIPVEGTRIDPELTAVTASVAFDTLYICDGETLPTTSGTLRLRNDGPIADTIVRVTPVGSPSITLDDPGFPLVIEPGSEATMTLRFAPQIEGDFSASYTFVSEPCGVEATVTGSGAALRPDLDVSPSSIDIGIVDIGTPEATGTVTIRNTGSVARQVQTSGLGSDGLRIISPTGSIDLAPGDSAVLTIGFLPLDSGTVSGMIVFDASAPCSSLDTVLVTGIGRGEDIIAIDFAIDVPTNLTGQVDDIIDIPVRSLGSSTAPSGAISEILVDLRFRATMLFPEGLGTSDPGVTASIESSTIVGSERHVRLRIAGQEITGGKVLATMRARVLLGDQTETPLDLEDLVVTVQPTYSVATAATDGSFSPLGLCLLDGERLVTAGTLLRLDAIRPNPASENVSVGFATTGDGDHLLRLYNTAGAVVRVLPLGPLEAGHYTLPVDLSRLPSGLYSLEISNERATRSEPLIVRQ